MSASEARTAYERWHARLPVDAGADTPWHRLVVAALAGSKAGPGGDVLEIASGRGGFAAWLAGQPGVSRLVAIDFSRAAVVMGRTHASAADRPVDWIVGDIQSIPCGSGRFDCVFSCETIEHLLSPRQALAELFRVLRPGGRLYLTCPNYLGLMGLYRVYLRLTGRRFTEEGQPVNRLLLLPVTLLWLRLTGFRIESVHGAGHYLPWPGAPPRDLGALRPAWLTRWFALHGCVVALRPA